MATFTDNSDERANAATSFDRTVSYFMITVGVVLGFLLILSTLRQVNRVTAEPSQDDPAPVERTEQAEIGTSARSQLD